jgi:hypothetical protein
MGHPFGFGYAKKRRATADPYGMTTRKANARAKENANAKANAGVLPHSTSLRVRVTCVGVWLIAG